MREIDKRKKNKTKKKKKTPMHKNGQISGLTFNVLLGIKPFASPLRWPSSKNDEKRKNKIEKKKKRKLKRIKKEKKRR